LVLLRDNTLQHIPPDKYRAFDAEEEG